MSPFDQSTMDPRLQLIVGGDSSALASIFEENRPRLRRMVQLRIDRRIQGRADPSDVLQEAYLEIAGRASEYAARMDMPFFLWLRMLVGQKLLEVHRRHLGAQCRDAAREVSLFKSYPEVNSTYLASQLLGRFSSASQVAGRHEMQSQLETILNRMEPIDREILTLRHFEELNNGEAAHVLGLSKTAASNRYIRALARLKQELAAIPGFFA